jgi:hypothetical protein
MVYVLFKPEYQTCVFSTQKIYQDSTRKFSMERSEEHASMQDTCAREPEVDGMKRKTQVRNAIHGEMQYMQYMVCQENRVYWWPWHVYMPDGYI